MNRRHSRALTLFVTLMMIAFIVPASASEADRPSEETLDAFSGTFTSRESRASMEERVERAINSATASMNFITRPIARNRLRAITSPCMRFTFTFDDENVTYQCAGQPPHVSPIDGSPVRREGHGREPHVLTHEIREDRIIQTMRADDGGVRETVFELDLTRTAIRAHMTISSDQLRQSVKYNFEYVKQR